MNSNYHIRSLSDDDNESIDSHSSGCTDSVSTVSTNLTTFGYSTCPNFDNTEWAISKPDTYTKVTRYILKRTVFVYGIDSHVTKTKIFHVFSQFGPVMDVVGVKDSHYVLGRPDLEHGRKLTAKYVKTIDDPNRTTCFYVIFETKGGFNKCAQKALNNPYFNIFKMDKRLKDFKLRRLS